MKIRAKSGEKLLETITDFVMNWKFIYAALAGIGICLTSCDNEDPKPAFPEISVNNGEVILGYEGKTTPITVTSNRDFEIENDVDWLAFDYDPFEIEAGKTTSIVVNVTALTNQIGNSRTAKVRFKTKAVYADVVFRQAENPEAAPEIVYYSNFGESLKNLDNPILNTSNCWTNVEEGPGAATVKYYMPDGAKVSARNSSTNSSSGYSGASGNNFLWFGTAGELVAGNIAVHPKLTGLKISFGLQRAEYQASDNNIKPAEFPVWVSKDGASWVPLTYTVTSPGNGTWSLCYSTFSFDAGSIDSIWLRMCPTKTSTYRFDDLKISNSTTGDKIDWSKNAVSFTLGSEITF